MKFYVCPVCHYAMNAPAKDHQICSGCGTQFDYDDVSVSHEQLRTAWIAGGKRWWSKAESEPERNINGDFTYPMNGEYIHVNGDCVIQSRSVEVVWDPPAQKENAA